VLPARDDEPTPPTNDRRRVVRRPWAGPYAGTFSGSRGSSTGSSSGGSSGSSRGTGSSSGSTVTVRSGFPISIAPRPLAPHSVETNGVSRVTRYSSLVEGECPLCPGRPHLPRPPLDCSTPQLWWLSMRARVAHRTALPNQEIDGKKRTSSRDACRRLKTPGLWENDETDDRACTPVPFPKTGLQVPEPFSSNQFQSRS
jgi:hypothetical protein